MLEQYDLTAQFAPLIDSITRGNLQQFNQAMEQHEEYFIQKGVFLILEKLKIGVYRNLFSLLYSRLHVPYCQQKQSVLEARLS